MKTFKDFYEKQLSMAKTGAKINKISVTEFLKTHRGMTRKEFRQFQLTSYKRKTCHSFWHRECENRDIECYHCNHYYSLEEYDMISPDKKLELTK